MLSNKGFVTICVVCILLDCVHLVAAPSSKYVASETFIDSAGTHHSWKILASHTYMWDGEPFIPVGCEFQPQSLVSSTDDLFDVDTTRLLELKNKKITDVILKPSVPITSVNQVRLQRLIDWLDANSFTYGLYLNDGPKEPLRGYIVQPATYRLDGPSDETEIVKDWPDIDTCTYVIYNKKDGSIEDIGGASVADGKVIMRLSAPIREGSLLIVYPRKVLPPVEHAGMGDLWSGFGEYRDRILAYFKELRFGKGFRFFANPTPTMSGFTGDMVDFIPDSAAFRLGLESYLTKNRIHEGAVNSAWGLNETIESMDSLVRLLPLWNSGRGLPFVYDRATGKRYSADSAVSQIWTDIRSYRDSSTQEYMAAIADTLKKHVANVPVVFTAGSFSNIYVNPFSKAGFDGLAATPTDLGDAAGVQSGPTYSLAEESERAIWLVSLPYVKRSDKSEGFSDQITLQATFDSLRSVGCKGFYLRSGDADAGNIARIRQAGWLADFKDSIKPAVWTDYKPNAIYFPLYPMTGASVKKILADAWWLPTLRPGKTRYIGDGLASYALPGESTVCLWSISGDRKITLSIGPGESPVLAFPPGKSIVRRKTYYSVMLNDTPTLLNYTNFSTLFPVETAKLEIQRLTGTIAEAVKLKLDVTKMRMRLGNANTVLNNGQAAVAFGMAQSSRQDITKQLGLDEWAEGEGCVTHQFGNIKVLRGASSGLALVIDTNSDPPMSPYTASFDFTSNQSASYEIWIAGTPPADGSPLSYSVDSSEWIPVEAVGGKKDTYADGLAWYKIGTVNLFSGSHTLALKVLGKRLAGDKYYFALDAVMISPRTFTPNGIERPM